MKRLLALVLVARPCVAPLEQGRVSGRRVSRHFSHDHNSTGQRLFNAADYGGTRAHFDHALEDCTADDVNYRGDQFEHTPLMELQWHHDWPEQVQALIDRGADVNARDKYGVTALHIAAIHNRRDHARVLLAAGADRTIENIKNETAAVWARRHGNVELAFFIEEFGLEAEAESSSRELVAAAAEEAADDEPPDDEPGFVVHCPPIIKVLFEVGGLSDKVETASRWCEEMGAETIGDLGFGYHDGVAEKDFVVEFATALEPLPPIKKGKIVNKLRDVLKQIREKDEM